jgi:CRISPR-associated protein Csm1
LLRTNLAEKALAAWKGSQEATQSVNLEWPASGIAIEGDFSGIQRFVLRPVPGAGGAARRLRARSFRVLALTRLAAAKVEERFAQSGARLFYSAGGRFLVVAQSCNEWQERLNRLRQDLDDDLLRAYRGELVFHVAGAEFRDGKIPVAQLGEAMALRKMTPLRNALQGAGGWATKRFAFTSMEEARCDGCGSTGVLREEESERLCETCLDDRELGKRLLSGSRIGLRRSPTGTIRFAGERWAIAADGPIEIPHIAHTPRSDFDELAKLAKGREYLAYLRIDADRIGEQFRKLEGDPYRTWGLSTLLDQAFAGGVTELVRSRFTHLYPVYGGGDDLFVIGPWNQALDFAAAWRKEFERLTGAKLSFSAGIALAKPREHILTKSEEAMSALDDEAKDKGRDRIHALGATIKWSDFEGVYAGAQQLAALHATGKIKSSFLHDLLYLHDCARRRDKRWPEGDPRWHSRLCYQIERNLSGQARDFVTSAFLSPGKLWEHAGFMGRYAMLCSREAAAD